MKDEMLAVWPDGKIILKYFAIYNYENLPNGITFLPKYDKNFAKY